MFQIIKKVDNALADVTWHLFINDKEYRIIDSSTTCAGRVLQLYIYNDYGSVGCYQLDESKSSVDLSSDMYIYLRRFRNFPSNHFTLKGTSKTLYYDKGRRIWEPTILNPYINKFGRFHIDHNGMIQLQKLYTRQRPFQSGRDETFSTRMYRGCYENREIRQYGIYRYRLINGGKKTPWRTISIMKNDKGYFSIK